MEEIIKELKKIYNSLEDKVRRDIMKIIAETTGKMTLDEIDRRVKERLNAGATNPLAVADAVNAELRQDPEGFIHLTDELKDELTEAANQQVIKDNPVRTTMAYNLNRLIEQLESTKPKMFLEFDTLSEIVQYINIPVRMQIDLLIHLLNINKSISGEQEKIIYRPNVSAILNHEYKYMDKEKLSELINTFKLGEFMSSNSLKYRKARKEIDDIYEASKIDVTEPYKLTVKLADIFAKEPASLTEDDYQTITDGLDELHFKHLSHRIVKQLKKATIEVTKPTPVVKEIKREVKEVKPKLSQKELNQIYYEISKFYDLDKEKPKTTLSLDEIIYILSLMYKANMSEKTITRFLESTNREYKKNNPVSIYYQSYDKFASYNIPDIHKHLEMIEYILSEHSIFTCSKETYEITKELISEEINDIMDILNGNYTYEINSAKNLLKVNEE